jgi:hypothetical protein
MNLDYLMGRKIGHRRGAFNRVSVAAADQCRRGDALALAASMSAAEDRVFFTSIEPAGRPSLGGPQPGSAIAMAPRPTAKIMQTAAEKRRGRFMGGAGSWDRTSSTRDRERSIDAGFSTP